MRFIIRMQIRMNRKTHETIKVPEFMLSLFRDIILCCFCFCLTRLGLYVISLLNLMTDLN